MSVPNANPGEVADVRPLGAALATTPTRTLVKTAAVTVVRMVVPAGKEIPTHTAKGELVVQCLEGKVAFTACGKTHDLEAGHDRHQPAHLLEETLPLGLIARPLVSQRPFSCSRHSWAAGTWRT